ncbi:MAG: type IV pilus assembly protein PilM [Fimbriimonadaceae bacterium]|jgi:type IV pilus assembly protein PilM|nr:type IV pilus assembly protein PilM [Fimbriimonadaceae bacterium]
MSLSLFKKKNYVGIDIGQSTIKLIQIDRTSSGWRASRVLTVPTPEDSMRDGVVIDPDAVGLTIRAALRTGRITANTAIIGVSGGGVVVRNVRTTKMNQETLRKSIRYEAGRYISSSFEDSYIEFQILGDTIDNQIDVLIVACPKELANSRMRACQIAGLEVSVVDVEAFAAYRSLIECDEASVLGQMTVALVSIGSTATSVSVVTQGRFAMIRSIPQAGQTWTEALRTHFKLSHTEAEQGKAQLDLTPLLNETAVIENPPLRVLQPHVDDLIREVRRSLNYYQSQQTEAGQNNPVTHLVITGGGARLKGLAEYMSHKLGLQVAPLGAFSSPKITQFGEPDEIGMEYAVAAGLAIRAFSKSA